MKLETPPCVRPATPADIPAMMALDRGAPTAAHWTTAQYRKLFAGGDRIAFILEDAGVQAFAVARDLGPEWEIENIVVAPLVQRRGLGTRLLAALLDVARSRSVEAVFLEVRESNRAARALYEKSGFAASGRRWSYYEHPNEHAIVYKFSFPATVPKTC